MKKIFDIGIVTGVHGVGGDLKVFPYSNDPGNLSRQKYFLINGQEREVTYARVQGKFLILHFKGINNRNDAEEMKNTVLSLPREKASPLAEGEYYMEDLIGCRVYEEGIFLGNLEDIMETGANDVYSVIDENGRELLIPALKNVVLDVDIDSKRISVKLPEGLVDDEYI
jgi:16S rRNA processing protein RimM